MKKSVKVLLILAVLVFVFGNLITYLIKHTNSEIAQYGVLEDTFSTTLYLFKDEVVIDSAGGVLQTTAGDGERVAKGARIGALLTADTDESALHTFLQIEDRIDRLENKEESMTYSDTLRTDEQISSLAQQITAAAQRGDIQQIAKLKERLLLAKDEKNALSGNKEVLISILRKRQDELKSGIGSSIKQVYSPEAGMLFLRTDGFEDTMKTENAGELTPSALESYINAEPAPSGDCKILYHAEWDAACLTDAAQAERIQEGQQISLRYYDCGGVIGKAAVRTVSAQENGKVVLVFTADQAPDGLLQRRKTTAQVILHRYEGLRVPIKAIKEIDGQTGVYVQTVTDRTFKPIDIMYRNEKYAIVSENEKTKLKLYDTIVY